ncbi:kinetochore-associated protein DSN1 homolog isoform X2 [Hyla sarda]|uniref:kinetochore-associated protein DSN1 homolog isoform X2 n=1 Tax=Hyla sarda TaxID=327740 RepID=UPI0024C4669E|nr:kinetochore-associated protein DSN1 homolog isoform X2 [Hyla sarda]
MQAPTQILAVRPLACCWEGCYWLWPEGGECAAGSYIRVNKTLPAPLIGKESMETHHVTPTRSSPRKKFFTSPPVAVTSPAKRQKNSPNNLSFKETSPSPRQRRKSLRRSVGKKHRRTLPPIYHNAAALSDAISLELPESDRLSELLQSCFEFSLRSLENSLSLTDGFGAESFNVSTVSVKEKFKRFVERLSRDGTLIRCTEKPTSFMPSEEFEVAQVEINDSISKFTTESRRWEELLKDYKEKAEVLSRHLEESKVNNGSSPSVPDLPSSQNQVLQSKPDYGAILHQQGAVFDCMETVMYVCWSMCRARVNLQGG